MKNKAYLEKIIAKNDLGKLAAYSTKLNELTYDNRRKVLDVLSVIGFGESTDVDVFLNRIPYVVEITFIDEPERQIDLQMITRETYINRYGDERYC